MQENGITIASIDLAQDQTEGRKLDEIMAYLKDLGQISEGRFIQLVLMLNLAETLKMNLTQKSPEAKFEISSIQTDIIRLEGTL